MPDGSAMNESGRNSRGLVGLILLRALIVTLILLTAYPIFFEIPRTFYYIIAGTIVLSLGFLGLVKLIPLNINLCVQFFFDVAIVTAMIVVTGGEESLFPFFYALLIILASVYLGMRGALYVFFLSTLSYSVLLLYLSEQRSLPLMFIIYRFYFFTFLFVATTILSSILTERLKRRSDEFSQVRLTTEEILKSLPLEILTIDNSGNVVFSNIRSIERSKQIKEILDRGDAREKEIQLGPRSFIFVSQSIVNPESKLIGKLAIVTDVTELRKLQEDSKVAERVRLLAELGASFAHEIRNPLASICGSVEILASSSKPSKKLKHLSELILKEAQRVNGIIQDFLDFARIRPGTREKMLLGQLIDESIATLPRELIKSRKMKIIWQDDRSVWAWVDGERIKQVVQILLINGLEAIKDEGELRVSILGDDREVGIEVRDNGVGIKKEDLKRIFDPFYSGKKAGTGLGLAIAQRIVSEHNGRIEVKSRPGKGSAFVIWLPVGAV